MCCTTNSKIRKLHGPASIWDHQQKHKVMTNSMLYKICREILFQKVALGYVLHFVQNESSENILKHTWLHNNLKQNKLTKHVLYIYIYVLYVSPKCEFMRPYGASYFLGSTFDSFDLFSARRPFGSTTKHKIDCI